MIKSFFYFLESLPWTLGVIAIIVIFTAFANLGIMFTRRTFAKDLKSHHDVLGFVFTNLGVLYSVLLGFTVVNVQQRFDQINTTIKTEAAYLAELYRDAEAFSEKDQKAIQEALKNYTKSILHDEWTMAALGKPHPRTSLMLNSVWHAYYNTDLSTNKEEILYAESIRQLNNLINVRLSRLLGGSESLNNEMWILLIAGGIIVVGFICLFSFESLWLHLMLACILASSTAFLLFLIYTLDTAFSGSVKVVPEALQTVLEKFSQMT